MWSFQYLDMNILSTAAENLAKVSAAERERSASQKLQSAVEVEKPSSNHSESEIESSWDGSNLSYSDVVLPKQILLAGAASAGPPGPASGLQQSSADEKNNGPTKTSVTKPPHSFSMLIFLAIESSKSKALPVRDIYSWITHNFPYYQYAPVGWKNSVRHNLSLNKCFSKFERGLNVGKGSLWMVDPAHRPSLIQSMCKIPSLKAEVVEQLINEQPPPTTTPIKVKL